MFCDTLPLQYMSKTHFFWFFLNGVDLPPSYLDNVFKYICTVFFTTPLRQPYPQQVTTDKGCRQKKKNSIFKDIVQIGGREVNPISKKWKEMIFCQSWRGRGSQKKLSKSTLFCMIYYSIWPNQGTLCLSVPGTAVFSDTFENPGGSGRSLKTKTKKSIYPRKKTGRSVAH